MNHYKILSEVLSPQAALTVKRTKQRKLASMGPHAQKKLKQETGLVEADFGSYKRIYELLTEVSMEMAAQAAGKARRERGSPYIHADRTEDQIKRIKAKFAQRAITKHGEAGTTTVLGPPGEVPAELGGGRHERSRKQVPKRTLFSGGRRETRAETVSRKFEKAIKKASK
jgi:hypothetical protein